MFDPVLVLIFAFVGFGSGFVMGRALTKEPSLGEMRERLVRARVKDKLWELDEDGVDADIERDTNMAVQRVRPAR